jgi:hypothetical protein
MFAGDDPKRTQPKQPGRVENPDQRHGKEWTAPEPDPVRHPNPERPPARPGEDPERKVFGAEGLDDEDDFEVDDEEFEDDEETEDE